MANPNGGPNWFKGMKKGTGGQGPGMQKGQKYKLKPLEFHMAEIEIRLGRQCDPVVTLVELAAGHDAYMEQQVEQAIKEGRLDPSNPEDIKRIADMRAVDTSIRVDAAKACTRFIRPVLGQTTIVGPNGGPLSIATAQFPVKELMTNDEIAGFVENMQIALAKKATEDNSQQDQSQTEEQDDGGTQTSD